MKFWLKQIAIAFDQLLNTLVGGWADETLSSHAYRLEQEGKPMGFMRPIIDALLWFDPNHCEASFDNETKRLQLPPEARKTP